MAAMAAARGRLEPQRGGAGMMPDCNCVNCAEKRKHEAAERALLANSAENARKARAYDALMGKINDFRKPGNDGLPGIYKEVKFGYDVLLSVCKEILEQAK